MVTSTEAIATVRAYFERSEPVQALVGILGHEPRSVLEAAAGRGELSTVLAAAGARVLIVDSDPENILTASLLIEAARNVVAATGGDAEKYEAFTLAADGRDLRALGPGEWEVAWTANIERLPWTGQVQLLRELARVSSEFVAFVQEEGTYPELDRAGISLIKEQALLDGRKLVVGRKKIRRVD